MRRTLVLAPLLATLLIAAAPQKRASDKPPADFAAVLASAKEAWSAGKYGACLGHLQEATTLATAKRFEAILAALPDAPEGYEIVPDKSREQLRTNQLMGGLAAAIGNIITREYRGPERLKITVTADSPMVQMLGMAISNPAMLDANSELIEYTSDKGILKRTGGGSSRDLTLILAGKHVCQFEYGGSDEDFLFALADQAMVDELKAALAN